MSTTPDDDMTGHANKRHDLDDRVTELHAAGLGRNAIATELGCATGLVTKIAQRLGLPFDATRTAAATAGAYAKTVVRRAKLGSRFLDVAESALDKVENAEASSDAKSWMTVAGIAVDKLAVLDKIENGDRVQVGVGPMTPHALDQQIEKLINRVQPTETDGGRTN
ncbi:hypothetical protein AB9M10_15595 [Rhodococcus erythropolis]